MQNTRDWSLDHIAIACARLEDGVDWVQQRLGLPMGPGGRHPVMGTHNRLMAMGNVYLEVIAPDPDGGPVGWFGLDHPPATPRLVHWICRASDVQGVEVARGAFRWRITVPDGGALPMDGAQPSLITWLAGGHPLDHLPATPARLDRLDIRHPKADPAWACDPRVHVAQGPLELRAQIAAPTGVVTL